MNRERGRERVLKDTNRVVRCKRVQRPRRRYYPEFNTEIRFVHLKEVRERPGTSIPDENETDSNRGTCLELYNVHTLYTNDVTQFNYRGYKSV